MVSKYIKAFRESCEKLLKEDSNNIYYITFWHDNDIDTVGTVFFDSKEAFDKFYNFLVDRLNYNILDASTPEIIHDADAEISKWIANHGFDESVQTKLKEDIGNPSTALTVNEDEIAQILQKDWNDKSRSEKIGYMTIKIRNELEELYNIFNAESHKFYDNNELKNILNKLNKAFINIDQVTTMIHRIAGNANYAYNRNYDDYDSVVNADYSDHKPDAYRRYKNQKDYENAILNKEI